MKRPGQIGASLTDYARGGRQMIFAHRFTFGPPICYLIIRNKNRVIALIPSLFSKTYPEGIGKGVRVFQSGEH